MSQKIIIWIITGLFIVAWGSFLVYQNSSHSYTEEEKALLEEQLQLENTGSTIDEIDKEDVKSKMSAIRQKLALKWLIHKWDLNFTNEKYTSALVNYLQIQRKIPSDQENIHKIALTYFELQKYEKAAEYFEKIPTFPKVEKHKAILSTTYSSVISPWTLSGAISKIQQYPLSEEEEFYYINSLKCGINFHECKLNFQNYFTKKEKVANEKIALLKIKQDKLQKEAIENGTEFIQKEISVPFVDFPELENIRLALLNYENLNMDDLSYKGGLISLAYLKNKNFPIAIRSSRDVLKNFPNYRPAIKIIALSYYEMWDYLNAKKFLVRYNKLWDNDPEISYALGIVYQKLKEYVLSSIHLNKALKLNYPHGVDVRRRQIFNYYEIWDTQKMLKAFETMVSENADTLSEQDLSLAIFHNIIQNNLDAAKKYADLWKEKFPDSDRFYGYIWWLQLETAETQEEISSAEIALKKWLEINQKSAMIHFSLWRLELKKNDKNRAFAYFKKTVSLDKHGDFTKLAREQLDIINQSKTESNPAE